MLVGGAIQTTLYFTAEDLCSITQPFSFRYSAAALLFHSRREPRVVDCTSLSLSSIRLPLPIGVLRMAACLFFEAHTL
jgi:hypothetical protein